MDNFHEFLKSQTSNTRLYDGGYTFLDLYPCIHVKKPNQYCIKESTWTHFLCGGGVDQPLHNTFGGSVRVLYFVT